MISLKKFFNLLNFFKEKLGEKGQGMVEYALILAAVAIIAVVAIWGTGKTDSSTDLKTAVTNAFTKDASAVEDAQTKH